MEDSGPPRSTEEERNERVEGKEMHEEQGGEDRVEMAKGRNSSQTRKDVGNKSKELRPRSFNGGRRSSASAASDRRDEEEIVEVMGLPVPSTSFPKRDSHKSREMANITLMKSDAGNNTSSLHSSLGAKELNNSGLRGSGKEVVEKKGSYGGDLPRLRRNTASETSTPNLTYGSGKKEQEKGKEKEKERERERDKTSRGGGTSSGVSEDEQSASYSSRSSYTASSAPSSSSTGQGVREKIPGVGNGRWEHGGAVSVPRSVIPNSVSMNAMGDLASSASDRESGPSKAGSGSGPVSESEVESRKGKASSSSSTASSSRIDVRHSRTELERTKALVTKVVDAAHKMLQSGIVTVKGYSLELFRILTN